MGPQRGPGASAKGLAQPAQSARLLRLWLLFLLPVRLYVLCTRTLLRANSIAIIGITRGFSALQVVIGHASIDRVFRPSKQPPRMAVIGVLIM